MSPCISPSPGTPGEGTGGDFLFDVTLNVECSTFSSPLPCATAVSAVLIQMTNCIRILALALIALNFSCDRPKKTSSPPATASSLPLFTNISKSAGLTAISYCGGPSRNHLLESTGQGCAFIDYDDDGLLDIIVLSGHQLDDNPERRTIVKKGGITLYRN